MRSGIVAGLAILTVAASGSAVYAWQQLKTNEAFLNATLKTATEIVDTSVDQAERYGVPRAATLALLTRAEGLFDNMALLGKPTAELRHQKAWMLTQFARNYKALGSTMKWRERSEQAFKVLADLATEAPDNALYARDLAMASMEIGDVHVSQGDLPGGLKAYRAVLVVIAGLAKSNPDDAGLQVDVALARERIADVLVTQGNLAEALQVYRESLGIRENVAKADPGDVAGQQHLSISYEKLGDVMVAQGDPGQALKAYRDALAIADRLAKAEPNNMGWQRDLSVAHNKIGNVLVTRGDLAGALQAYQDSWPFATVSPRPIPTMRSGSAISPSRRRT